jgi:hypothetical protein
LHAAGAYFGAEARGIDFVDTVQGSPSVKTRLSRSAARARPVARAALGAPYCPVNAPEGGNPAELRNGDVLVASKLDRCFRSARDCLNTVHALKLRRVSFYLLDLAGGSDDLFGNVQSQFFLNVLAAVADFERERIGERNPIGQADTEGSRRVPAPRSVMV